VSPDHNVTVRREQSSVTRLGAALRRVPEAPGRDGVRVVGTHGYTRGEGVRAVIPIGIRLPGGRLARRRNDILLEALVPGRSTASRVNVIGCSPPWNAVAVPIEKKTAWCGRTTTRRGPESARS